MEVSQIAQLDTHAIIGGGEAKAFGMDDSAELYALLSDKIYRDKKRAAMRETICNAWDAHIMVGKTDVPVEITLTDTEIVIRDFGPGIPDELMHPIYCVYGKSTKVKDEKQTGGFGLGSKSPFAVTDHFNVMNHHAGFKTVYAISRGGAATDGKPDMRVMVRVPTTESGLTVTIPIKDRADRQEFEQNIRAVVRQGGMLANLNGMPLPRNDYAEARKQEFCVLPNIEFTEGSVYVLYGTVMYPLTTTDNKLLEFAKTAHSYCGYNSVLVLIAPPNSIGITPSREALSLTADTDAELWRLLRKACARIQAAIPAALDRYLATIFKKDGRQGVDNYISAQSLVPGLLSTPDMIADHAVRTYGRACAHQTADHNKKFKVAQKVFRDDRRYFRRARHNRSSGWELEFRRTSMPMMRIAAKMGLLKDLMLFDLYRYRTDGVGAKTRKIGEWGGEGRVYPTLCVARNLRDLRPTLSGQAGDHNGREPEHYIAGVVMRQWTEKNLKQLRDLCDHYKVKLHVFDYEEAKKVRAPKKVKTEDKYLILEDHKQGHFEHSTPSCDEPSYYLMTYQREQVARLPFRKHLLNQVAKQFPKTALITTKTQEEKLQKAGIRNLAEVAAERLIELTKLREVVYGETIRHGRMIRDHDYIYSGTTAKLVLDLSRMDVRLAKLLFPDKATPGEAHKEAVLLWELFVDMQYLSESAGKLVKEARNGLVKACNAAFPPARNSALEERFSYLDVLRGASIAHNGRWIPGSKLADDLIETVKFLQRRHTQSKFTDNTKPANADGVPQKEAA
ncbi:rIIA protector from prophage-induced early lysis protein [Rhizobium phage RHph_N1_15]|nr:rIIA protector from prophage-induced early lysis protein [Rhizobium phage RHph_N1_10]QIG69321.1 rIIA protector from prophage-induced early lysis protein [Rhizobium phage RHph_N1_15]QIG75181.1 rIIA protector from prophage-induced early lysis protein [Rhizobium phage RHph_N2_6]